MWLVPCILYVNTAAPLLVVTARGMNEGLKGRVPHCITRAIVNALAKSIYITKDERY